MTPWFMTMIRSAIDMASNWSCVTYRVVAFRRSWRVRSSLHMRLAHLRIQGAERLVHQERHRLAHDGAAKGDALAVSARQPRHPPVEEVLDAQERRGLLDAPPAFPARHTLALQGKGDVVVYRHVRVEREELEHECDVAARRPQKRHVLAVEQDLT